MKEIKLTKGKVAIVDVGDYEWLSKFKWQAVPVSKNANGEPYWYASRGVWLGGGRTKTYMMHREIMGVNSSGMIVDHKDFDTLNNQRSNLRLCSKSENCCHTRLVKNKTSKFIGVSRLPKNKWLAKIRANKQQVYLGSFDSEVEAAKAYNNAATNYHGEFATLNIIE